MTDQPNLRCCSSSDLATFLLENRFQSDAMETTSFLLECTQCLPDAEAISAKIMGGNGGGGEGQDVDDSDDEVVEVEAVVAISHDDEDCTKGQEEESNGNNTAVAVSSGEVIGLPKSIAEDNKKGKGSGDDSPPTSPAAPMRRTSVEVSATTPRGKFDLTMHESTGIILKNKKDEIVTVPSTSVDTVIVFPKAEDCRKPTGRSNKKGPVKRPGPLVLVVLDDDDDGYDVTFRGRALKQICFQLPQTFLPFRNDDSGEGSGIYELEENKGGKDDDDEKKDIELEWVDLLGKTFGVSSEKVVLVSNPAYLTDDGREERAYCGRYEFKSDTTEGTSTTTAGMPYVKCYESVNDGVMYPLEEGLLFFKPPKFVPRSTLHSIQCGRGGGDSRYVDLVATLEGDESAVEFSNIAREEVRVLNDYIHKTLIKAMAKDAAEGEEEDGNEVSSRDNDKESDSVIEIRSSTSGDEDDEDLSSDGGRKRSRRAASKGAREATKAQLQAKAADDSDEDEEEEDYEMESELESESDDPSSNDEAIDVDDATESEADEEDEDSGDDDDDDDDETPKKKIRID